MYNIIGKALFFIHYCFIFALKRLALLSADGALQRSVYLAGFFANVLDFFICL